MIRIPVTLELAAADGAQKLRVHTVSVNDHGALLMVSQALEGGAVARLQHDRTGEVLACHVVRNSVEMPDGHYAAIEFDSPTKGFWHISFPPLAR